MSEAGSLLDHNSSRKRRNCHCDPMAPLDPDQIKGSVVDSVASESHAGHLYRNHLPEQFGQVDVGSVWKNPSYHIERDPNPIEYS